MSNLITYHILGSLPAPWEDFYPEDKTYPLVTLETAWSHAADDCADEDAIVVDAPSITEDNARDLIAQLIGVTADRILIVQDKFAQSV